MIVKDFKRPVVMLPEPVASQTAPDLWTFEQLAHCSERTVARIVRMGRKPLVRADVMAAIEREREGL